MAKQSSSSFEQYLTEQIARLNANAYEIQLGEPINLSPDDFESLLARMRSYRDFYPGMSFWVVINLRDNVIVATEGAEDTLGVSLHTRFDLIFLIQPDYVPTFFRWVHAGYELSMKIRGSILPMQASYRMSMPFRHKNGDYYWYSIHTTVTQVDANGYVISYLNTYYMEGKWSERSLKPFETYLQLKNEPDLDVEQKLYAIMAPFVIDEFTNSELEVITLYAAGQSGENVAQKIGWSKYTLYEYNTNILKKARRIFQYDFRTAKAFAKFCLEKGFIYPRQNATPK
ncbi:MAG: hypothetical protein WCR52_05110 [Bacteroidota bacterium]